MVTNRSFSSLEFNGIHEWLLLRFSSIFILFYVLYIFIFFLTVPVVTYEVWFGFFSSYFTKTLTLLMIFFVLIHAWIGMRCVVIDYIKFVLLRLFVQFLILIVLIVYTIYGIMVVCGT